MPWASGITGGGWDRDNSEEWNREGHPWPKWSWCWGSRMTHFGFNPLQERAKNFWEAQGSSHVLLSTSLPIPLSSPSAAATHSSGFIQDVAPFDDDCRSTPSNRVVAKGAASQEITCCSVCHWGPDKLHGADCNEHQLFHCSASGVPAQQSLSFITFSTSLSFPLRNLLTCWNQSLRHAWQPTLKWIG